MSKRTCIIFDWGDTLMLDYKQYNGPMAHWPEIALVPGIQQALTLLGKDHTLCVTSNAGDSDAQLMGQALDRGGIKQHFQFFFTSKELGSAKPDPEFFKQVLKMAGKQANECVYIGNDYLNDIVPAKKAGMETILFCAATDYSECLSADAVIGSMEDLTSTIDALP